MYNGQLIKLIKPDSLGFNYVQLVNTINGQEIKDKIVQKGFIISEYCGKPTIKKIEKIHIPKFKGANDLDFYNINSPKSDLLSYAFAYVSPEADFIQVLSFNAISGSIPFCVYG